MHTSKISEQDRHMLKRGSHIECTAAGLQARGGGWFAALTLFPSCFNKISTQESKPTEKELRGKVLANYSTTRRDIRQAEGRAPEGPVTLRPYTL